MIPLNFRRLIAVMVLGLVTAPTFAAAPPPDPSAPPEFTWHLTARPWHPQITPASAYLDVAEPLARAMAKSQNAKGQIIDPYEHREVQYSTAYFAYGVGSLVHAGRAKELLPAGIAAMDSATEQFARGADAIDNHAGEFVIAPLTEAIALYAPQVPPEKVKVWKKRMARPLEGALRGLKNNWQAYAMRGEWLRCKMGLISRKSSCDYIETCWTDTQIKRLQNDSWGLYHDETSDPDAFAVDPVGRDNLMGLILAGYDGPSTPKMKDLLMKGARSSLFLQDPTGQAPGGGRNSGHVWNDLVTLISNEQMAELSRSAGEADSAGRFRRGANLALQSLKRWQRRDGSFWVTKNQFDPTDRVGYSQASFFTNYNNALLFHLAEAYELRKDQPAMVEAPSPSEAGGYVLASDPAFAGIFANAGGMFLQGFSRGATLIEKKQYWTTLGITRFSRPGWDSRLGAVEALRDTDTGTGVTFSPTFKENGKWISLANVPDRYQGHLSAHSVSPMLERFTIEYIPVSGKSGPTFHNTFTVTPDGVLAALTADGAEAGSVGITLPLLENDGSGATELTVKQGIAATRIADGQDQLAYLALKSDGTSDHGAKLDISTAAIRGGYGYIRPVRCISTDPAGGVFIYPRAANDPPAAEVAASFRRNGNDFSSALGRVEGDLYIGRNCAGGFGDSVDINHDGKADVTFTEKTQFIIQFSDRTEVTAIETDRTVIAKLGDESISLLPYTPWTKTEAPRP